MVLFRRTNLRFRITVFFVTLLVISLLSVIIYTYRTNQNSVLILTNDLIKETSNSVIFEVENHLKISEKLIKIVTSNLNKKDFLITENLEYLENFGLDILNLYAEIAMFNIGDKDGNFFMLKKMRDNSIATKIIIRNADSPKVIWKYRNEKESTVSTEIKYDHRIRPWYKKAIETNQIYWSDIYLFFSDKKPGITVSYPMSNGNEKVRNVLSFDIALGELREFLKKIKIGKTGFVMITNSKNEVIANPIEDNISISENGEKLKILKINELKNKIILSAQEEYKKSSKTKINFNYDGKNYISFINKLSGVFDGKWKIISIVAADDFLSGVKKANKMTLYISLIIFVISIIISAIVSNSVCKPINFITKELVNIKKFDFSSDFDIKTSVKEIFQMTEAVKSMRNGLNSFKKYVPSELVRKLILSGEDAVLGGKKKTLTVFFSDIAGFTTISEQLEPEELTVRLNEYLEELTKIIMRNNGTIDKYIGDAIMAFWGAPQINDNQIYDACKSALLCAKKIKELNKKWIKEGKCPFITRMGLHSDELIVGNLGSESRLQYSIIGENISLAEQLEGLNKKHNTSILISENVYKIIKDKFVARQVDFIKTFSDDKKLKVYELCEEK